jgi:hypothetical protein
MILSVIERDDAMILRRLMKHIKEQNWFAVGLDFGIVVLGVIIGFQVTAWNEGRGDAIRADAYLERIHSDLAADTANYVNRSAFWTHVSDHGLLAMDAVNHNAASGRSAIRSVDEDWQIILNFFQASQVNEFRTIETAYLEVTSAGELSLIENANIRSQIAAYYSQSGNYALTERPVYRETVRGIIPIRMQHHVWSHCWTTDGTGDQRLLDCGPPEDTSRLDSTARALLSDDNLHRQLRFWLSTLRVLPSIAMDRNRDAVALSEAIQAELETRR